MLNNIDKIKAESENSNNLWYDTVNNVPGALKKYCYFVRLKKDFPANNEIIHSFFKPEQNKLFNTIESRRRNDILFNKQFEQKFLLATAVTSMGEIFKTFVDILDSE